MRKATVESSSSPSRSAKVRLRHKHIQRRTVGVAMVAGSLVSTIALAASGIGTASAATPTIALANAAPFAVLAATTITNTGSSVIHGDIGLAAGTSVTGFPPGTVTGGTFVADSNATTAHTNLTAAYLDAAARTPVTTISADLGGSTLTPGNYQSTSSLSLTGALTLNGGGDLNSIFIFQAGSSLTTAGASSVVL